MSVEMILIVVLVVFACLVVGVGRVTNGRQLVDQAAAAASRDAALATDPGQATDQARRTAADTLAQAGVSCTQMQVSVDVTRFHPGGQVAVTIDCTVDLSGLAPAGLPPTSQVTATSTTPLETYRVFTGTPS